MSDVLIRRAGASDWPELWPIWHDVVSAGDTNTYDPATSAAVARHGWIDAPDVLTWLAEIDGQVVGFYKITPNQTGPGSHVANGSYMVDTRARNQGIGARLVRHSSWRRLAPRGTSRSSSTPWSRRTSL